MASSNADPGTGSGKPGLQVVIWDDARTKKEISRRWRHCTEARIFHEEKWIRNERSVYATSSTQNMSYLQTSLESNFNIGLPGIDGSNADMNIGQTFKNFRLIHAQMSSNPPSVVMRPTNSDQENHRKADAADRAVRYSIRRYSMQERQDQTTLQTLLYGSGCTKTTWDANLGDILSYTKDSRGLEVTLSGDISVTVPFMWNVFIDPDAKCVPEIRYIIERLYIDYEEACLRWPEHAERLKAARVEKSSSPHNRGRDTQLQNDHYNCVELLEYWETGLPVNGYLGRYCITTGEGDVIEPCRPSPFRFKQAGAVSRIEGREDMTDDQKEASIEALPETARLPYHFLTDIDIPNMPWGRSFIEYAAQQQETLNKLDSARIDNIQAHGVARLVIPESADIADDGLSNSPWDVTKISGAQPPYFMQPPQLMPDMTAARQDLVSAIDSVSGVNESMFGQQSREQAAAAMQYATNQGNMVRRRLFNKYVLYVESMYKAILDLVRKHWTTSRIIQVVGKERALESIELSGADIDGGYDVVGEYGVSLSLDPITRRQEILTLQPMFEKAGVPPRTSMKMMKLNELEGMYDELDLADIRQKEIFDLMIATGQYIPPKKYRDHVNMIAYAMRYFMTQEFDSLPDNLQQLCERHTEERAHLAATNDGATGPSPASSLPGGPPGPLPAGASAAPAPPPGLPAGAPPAVPGAAQ